MARNPEDITGLLVAWSKGDEKALVDLMPVVYEDLRRIARQHLGRRFSGHTPSALCKNDPLALASSDPLEEQD